MSRRGWIKATRPRGKQWVAVLFIGVFNFFQGGAPIAGLVVGVVLAWAVVAIYNNHRGKPTVETTA